MHRKTGILNAQDKQVSAEQILLQIGCPVFQESIMITNCGKIAIHHLLQYQYCRRLKPGREIQIYPELSITFELICMRHFQ